MSKESQFPYSEFTAEAHAQSAQVIQIEGGKLAIVSLVVAVLAIMFAFCALLVSNYSERETRIMKDDLKYIRAYLSARGIEVPANHEAAEDR